MPPSGFIKIETSILSAFAENILTRFTEEVRLGKFPSFKEGVKFELKIIDKHLSLTDISYSERGVLELIKQFYLALQAGNTMEQIVSNISNLQNKHYY